jgi:hypothetical protein
LQQQQQTLQNTVTVVGRFGAVSALIAVECNGNNGSSSGNSSTSSDIDRALSPSWHTRSTSMAGGNTVSLDEGVDGGGGGGETSQHNASSSTMSALSHWQLIGATDPPFSLTGTHEVTFGLLDSGKVGGSHGQGRVALGQQMR